MADPLGGAPLSPRQEIRALFRAGGFILFLAALLVLSIIFATAIGVAPIPYTIVIRTILNQLPYVHLEGPTAAQEVIILTIRLPRVLLAAIVGGGLAISGTALQGLFRNPMADPGVIGLSGGGALAAVMAISSGLAFRHYLVLPAVSFLGALSTAFLVYFIATRHGKTPVTTLLLSGVAVGGFLVSMISLILSRTSSIAMLREILFWLMGGLDARGWDHLKMALLPIALGSVGLLFFSRDLNILTLEGEEGAMGLGLSVKKVQRSLLILSSLVTGAAVAVSGIIGFVGLMVPHLLRIVIGANYRVLLPASFLAGASFLVGADILARTWMSPEELRLGTITSLIGAPFFLYLLQRHLRNVP